MPYKKGKRVKRRTHKENAQELKEKLEAPKSLVFCRGKVGTEVNTLMREWREAMLPHTADRLKVVKRDKIKDIGDLARTYECSSVHAFSCSPAGTAFRIVKAPQGPTLTFRVESFSLRSDILKEQRRHNVVSDSNSFAQPPLVVFNQFNNVANHLQLVMTTFQGMFPNIPVDTFKLTHCHRVLLINYNKQYDVLELRHYGILARSTGLSTAAKKLSRKIIPKRIGELEGIEDLFGKGGDYLSDTDGEGEEVDLPQNFRNLTSGTQTRLKLCEIGPRMTLSLLKVESGFWGGETLYHQLYEKSAQEIAETAQRIKMRDRLKQMRKKEQASNVAKKKQAAEDAKAEKEKKRQEKREKAGKRGEEDDEGDFEVVREGGDDDEGEDMGDDGAEADVPMTGVKRKAHFDDVIGDDDADEDAGDGEDAAEADDYPDEEDDVPRKQRKPITRAKRKMIKQRKQAENQWDEW